ncbi:general odorant-binding protein 56a-like [Zootermopsis nevadensis]|uniref:Uncharacterized protein n=1 Tax=Zootermopsis nevadensis TaxID=136037 RepID=A0A067QXC5_ZOONE|nr:general odorant-binding protein 56a-like [Zootermopsis nevadensis]KDR15043.1 hypothetical protein L798_10946 [Zootermopsis nevadensis]
MELKTSFVTFVIIFCLPKVVPQSSDYNDEDFNIKAKNCQHEYGLTDGEFDEFMKRPDLPKEEPVESRRCFAECILTVENVMKDGKMDEDAIVKFVKESIEKRGGKLEEEKFRNGISACIKQSGTGKCMSGYNSWICIMRFLTEYRQ